jgi:ABC-type multidrug transport system fused ATPase/permease subunit
MLQHAVQLSAQFEVGLNSVERVRHYCLNLEAEPPEFTHTPTENNKENAVHGYSPSYMDPEKSTITKEELLLWPSAGAVTFENVSFKYRKDAPTVLKNVSVDVKPREKIGIVGRTGSGKSTLMVALFRIMDVCEGSIKIDGVDIRSLGITDLRSKLCIIPQEAVLFQATVRFNLDPFEAHGDEELWNALEKAQLKDYIAKLENGLQYQVDEGGSNFSMGQRQLLCIARAILQKPRILMLDEATASVDQDSDDLLQRMIRKCFDDCTVITIAHRLNTIIDSDRILVMDQGEVAEFDGPNALLQQENSIFGQLIDATGESTSKHLRKLAEMNAQSQ